MSSNTRVQLKQEEETFNRRFSNDRITLFLWGVDHGSDAISKQQNQPVRSHRTVSDWLKLPKMMIYMIYTNWSVFDVSVRINTHLVLNRSKILTCGRLLYLIYYKWATDTVLDKAFVQRQLIIVPQPFLKYIPIMQLYFQIRSWSVDGGILLKTTWEFSCAGVSEILMTKQRITEMSVLVQKSIQTDTSVSRTVPVLRMFKGAMASR